MAVYLKEIQIKNYKGFNEGDNKLVFARPDQVRKGSGLTILVGPNNSGKSSIIECLAKYASLGASQFKPGVDYQQAKRPNIKVLDSNDNLVVLERDNIDDKVMHSGTVSLIGSYFKFIFNHQQWKDVFVNGMIEANQYGSESVISLQKDKYCLDDQFGRLLIDLLSSEDKKTLFYTYMRAVCPDFSQWSLESKNATGYAEAFYETKGGLMHPLSGIGSGMFRVIRILYYLTVWDDTDILIIDEPELSLHPQSQKALAKILFEASKERQIIISTHSPYFLEWDILKNDGVFVRIAKKEDLHSKIYCMNGCQSLKKILAPLNSYKNPHALDIVAKEIFFSRNIVFVEGQEDKGLLSSYIKSHFDDNVNFEIFGYGSGGGGQIYHFLNMATHLGIRCAAIFDSDQASEHQKCQDAYKNSLLILLDKADIRDKKDKPNPKDHKEGYFTETGEIKPELEADIQRYINQLIKFFNKKEVTALQ